MVADLSWDELNNTTGVGGLDGRTIIHQTVDDAYGSRFFLDLEVLLGREISSFTDQGVIEALVRLRELVAITQATVNQSRGTGEKISSLLPPSFGAVANGNLTLRAPIEFKVSVSPLSLGKISV